MDGEFACPNCGHEVKAPTPGPGRQARCSFCDTLVEVPFLPRVEGDWKRQRFDRPRWRAWAWWGASLCVVGLVTAAAVQALLQAEHSIRRGAIQRLIASSRAHETAGRVEPALLDLDTALAMAIADDDLPEAPAAIRDRRRDLARRDARAALQRLAADSPDSRALGGWLDLVARVTTDRDLAPLRGDVRTRFDATLARWLEDLATRAQGDSDPSAAFDACEKAVDLAVQLPSPAREAAVDRFKAIAKRLAARRGAALTVESGVHVRDASARYDEALHGPLVAALRSRGYLPPRARWSELWTNPPYRLSLAIRESFEGTYLQTQNRLTRIDAALTLTGPGGELWRTVPNARSGLDTHGASSFTVSRLALTDGRSDEAERLLYEDAFSRIRDKILNALSNLPPPR